MIEKSSPNAISIATLHAPKLDAYSIHQDGKILHVWDAVFIRVLSKVFQVPYKILIPADGEWGKKPPDGNWTGLIGMIHRSQADLAVGGIALTTERLQAADFSYPYVISEMSFVTDKPKPVPTTLALFYPFSWTLWISVMTAFLFSSFFYFILTLRKRAFGKVMLMIFGSVLGQFIPLKVKERSQRLFLSMWLISIFVITNSYKGRLLSFLSFPSVTGIRNIADLARAAEQNVIQRKVIPSYKLLLSQICEHGDLLGNA